ncbi:MAG: ECF RNA polymerase sigma factor SigH [Phycisphaerae bacterium]|nr:ECF RNA polymerase sigma factor SigH [Phycisphaerae bacterium]
MTTTPEELDDLVQRGYRFAYALTHDAARAEDLLQDAWVSVLSARGPWTCAYLLAAIRSRFVDLSRRQRGAPFAPLNADEIQDHSDDHGSPRDAESDQLEGEFADSDQLAAALGWLRVEERAVIYLWAVEEFTAQKIAEFLGWPRGTVLSLMHRARRRLRDWAAQRSGA